MTDIPPTFRLSEPEDFAVDISGDGTAATVRGEIDVLTAPFLWERIEPLIANVKDALVVDLGGVRFIDSMGLGVLVRAQSRLSHAGGRLVLRSVRDQARKVLEMTGLDRSFELEP